MSGILPNIAIVDTTGAGDAFIGGYLLALLVSEDEVPSTIGLAMPLGAWVAGRKLEGPGVWDALPTSVDVDSMLGEDTEQLFQQLGRIITSFRAPHASTA